MIIKNNWSVIYVGNGKYKVASDHDAFRSGNEVCESNIVSHKDASELAKRLESEHTDSCNYALAEQEDQSEWVDCLFF
jgi:hypothetical protein